MANGNLAIRRPHGALPSPRYPLHRRVCLPFYRSDPFAFGTAISRTFSPPMRHSMHHFTGVERFSIDLVERRDDLSCEAAPGYSVIMGVTEDIPEPTMRESLPAIAQVLREIGPVPYNLEG